MISGNLGAAESSTAPLPPFPEDPILAASAEGPFIFCEGQQGQCGHTSVTRCDHRLNLLRTSSAMRKCPWSYHRHLALLLYLLNKWQHKGFHALAPSQCIAAAGTKDLRLHTEDLTGARVINLSSTKGAYQA